MAEKEGGLHSPLELPHPMVDTTGDKRDLHDRNPAGALSTPHDKGPDTPSVVIIEGEDQGKAQYGRVHGVVPDVLSTPMTGQRRATGERESPKTEQEEL
jgi:hypothetical protein